MKKSVLDITVELLNIIQQLDITQTRTKICSRCNEVETSFSLRARSSKSKVVESKLMGSQET